MMTPMMAAIDAARNKGTCQNANIIVEPATTSTNCNTKNPHQKVFALADKVQYWSESKSKWVDAVVLKKHQKSNEIIYDLDVKCGATSNKLRAPPSIAEKPSTFLSFDSFNAKQSKKRGRNDSDSDVECKMEKSQAKPDVDWNCPPTELLPISEVCTGEAAAFIEHFVRFVIGEWERMLEEGGIDSVAVEVANGPEMKTFQSVQSLQQAKSMLAPLIGQLARGEVIEGVLTRLKNMASLAEKREYAAANKLYLEFTMGTKRWNNGHATCQGKQAVGGCVRMKSMDPLTLYDSDPVLQKYLQGMKRIIRFAQLIRPNADVSKHV